MKNNVGSPKPPLLAETKLTVRELECLALVSHRMGSKEIARTLNISPNTVDARLKSASAKLGTNSRFVAARIVAESDQFTVTTADTNLVSEPRDLSAQPDHGKMEASAGEGDSPGEIAPKQQLKPELHDSGSNADWREIHHLIANFGGLQKHFSTFRHWYLVIAIAFASSLALGAIINSLTELSKVLPSP